MSLLDDILDLLEDLHYAPEFLDLGTIKSWRTEGVLARSYRQALSQGIADIHFVASSVSEWTAAPPSAKALRFEFKPTQTAVNAYVHAVSETLTAMAQPSQWIAALSVDSDKKSSDKSSDKPGDIGTSRLQLIRAVLTLQASSRMLCSREDLHSKQRSHQEQKMSDVTVPHDFIDMDAQDTNSTQLAHEMDALGALLGCDGTMQPESLSAMTTVIAGMMQKGDLPKDLFSSTLIPRGGSSQVVKPKPGSVHALSVPSSTQMQQLENIADALNQDYLLRRDMLVSRMNLTFQSLMWSKKAQQYAQAINDETQELADSCRYVSQHVAVVEAFMCGPNVARIEAVTSGSRVQGTKSAVKNKIYVKNVPNRGGLARVDPSQNVFLAAGPAFRPRQAQQSGGGGRGRGNFNRNRGKGGGGGGGQGRNNKKGGSRKKNKNKRVQGGWNK